MTVAVVEERTQAGRRTVQGGKPGRRMAAWHQCPPPVACPRSAAAQMCPQLGFVSVPGVLRALGFFRQQETPAARCWFSEVSGNFH